MERNQLYDFMKYLLLYLAVTHCLSVKVHYPSENSPVNVIRVFTIQSDVRIEQNYVIKIIVFV